MIPLPLSRQAALQRASSRGLHHPEATGVDANICSFCIVVTRLCDHTCIDNVAENIVSRPCCTHCDAKWPTMLSREPSFTDLCLESISIDSAHSSASDAEFSSDRCGMVSSRGIVPFLDSSFVHEVSTWSHSTPFEADFVDLCIIKQRASSWRRPRRKHSLHAPEIALDDIVLDTPKHHRLSGSWSTHSTALNSSIGTDQPRMHRAASTPLPLRDAPCVVGIPVEAPLDQRVLAFTCSGPVPATALLDSAVVPPPQSSPPRASGKTKAKVPLRTRLLQALQGR